MVTKRVKKIKRVSAKNPLNDAIRELEEGMNIIRQEKDKTERQMKSCDSSIEKDRELIEELQKKVADLMKKEAELGDKKKVLQTKADKAADKISKISKIKSEMGDI